MMSGYGNSELAQEMVLAAKFKGKINILYKKKKNTAVLHSVSC